ncbi:MAG TPA: rhodanese-like domain-containing protein [Streptosporangiaceae bacterium]|nr:rhodanese-like domain-containing protein [Streptosporangiaceae bacterium]
MSVSAVSQGSAGGRGLADAGAGLRPGWGVSPQRQQEIIAALDGLAPGAGRLSAGQLRSIAMALVARRDLWADLVVRDPDVRWYLPLHRSNSCDVWLLAWERGQDTDWHDHGGSSGSFAVAEGCLTEQYRVPSGRLSRRRLTAGQAIAFGPGHVHDVAHGGAGSATSIHAYSPPLVAMTYYSATDYGLIARETVAIDGPEGGRGRGGADTALARASASAARLSSSALPTGAPTIDDLLAEARGGLQRLRPEAAFAALTDGAALIDIRPLEQRIVEGEVPGAIIIGRNVLEWRLDPRSEARIPALARADMRIIVMCSEGYASTLAAASLRRIGLREATDLDGGFQAWHAAGLPTRPAQALG